MNGKNGKNGKISYLKYKTVICKERAKVSWLSSASFFFDAFFLFTLTL